MKKLLLSGIILMCLFSVMPVEATTTTTTAMKGSVQWNSETGLARVEKIGKNLLSKNSLPTQVKFSVVETDDVNAFASGNNELCVYTGLLNYVQDDNELAGVIAHEIGHIINNHVAKQSIASTISTNLIQKSDLSDRVKTSVAIANNLSLLKMSRTQENEADVTGVDLMIKAGYNPLAMVSILYKISGTYIDILQTHPSGDKRTMYIYDYLTYTYPDKLKSTYKSDAYTQFVAYATPIVQKRNASESKLKAFNKKQAKLQEKRMKKLAKYKTSATVNPWTASYALLNVLSTSTQQ